MLTRRPPHPARLTGALKQKLPTLTWFCQCMKRTKQSTTCDISVRHTSYTVSGCEFVARYQNTSNLENHYVTTGTDHKELADRLTAIHHIDRKERLGSEEDGRITLSHTFVALAFTSKKKCSVFDMVTSSLSNGLFERIGLCPCPRTMTNSTNS